MAYSVLRAQPARDIYLQMPAYFRRTVSFDTPGIGTTGIVTLGTLPADAIVIGGLVKVTTAFNATTTNVLTIGTSTTVDAVLAAGDVDETTVGTTLTDSVIGYTVTSDTVIYIKYAQTGTAATTGAATVILWFVPDNDK